MHRKYTVMQGTKGGNGKSKSNVMDKRNLVDRVKMVLND